MTYTLQLTGMHFEPTKDTVFYVDCDDKSTESQWIRDNYEDLRREFRTFHKEFIYYPLHTHQSKVEKQVRYFAPYLSIVQLFTHTLRSDHLLAYMLHKENRKDIKPSMVCYSGNEHEGVFDFCGIEIADIIAGGTATFRVVHKINELLNPRRIDPETSCRFNGSMGEVMFSLKENHHDYHLCDDEGNRPNIRYRRYLSPEEEEFQNCVNECEWEAAQVEEGRPSRLRRMLMSKESERKADEKIDNKLKELTDERDDAQSKLDTIRLLEDLEYTVKSLQLSGVSLDAIHELIDKQSQISRIVITEDYRIFLPEYNDMEITMGALPKTLFFFFLRYPEGVILKHLPDYYNELCVIYRQLRPRTDGATLAETITKLVNPTRNAANENIARIRKAFVEKFDERLAKHYIVRGTAGCEYKIDLDRDLVIWDEGE